MPVPPAAGVDRYRCRQRTGARLFTGRRNARHRRRRDQLVGRAERRPAERPNAHTEAHALAFSPDGWRLAVGGRDGVVRPIELARGPPPAETGSMRQEVVDREELERYIAELRESLDDPALAAAVERL